MNSRYAWSTFLTLAFVVVLACDAMAVTYYTNSNGNWSLTLNGPDCGCSPLDYNGPGLIIEVRHNITLNGSLDIKSGYSLHIIAGKLTVVGNLTFSNGSQVLLEAGAGLTVDGNFENKNSSQNVVFNGAVTITGTFQNGSGLSENAYIYLGPNGTINTPAIGCDNAGVVIKTNPDGSMTQYKDCSGPLPVQLISFRALQLGTDVQLTWATASENGFQYFGIERADEELIFTEIGQVQGSGDSKVRIDYSYTDKALVTVGKTYYRLKAVDFDGYTEYFKVAYVDYRAPKAWAVTPNPAQDGHIVLTRNFSDDQPVVATLHSMSGAQLFSEQVSFVSNKYTFDTNLKPGMYVLTLKTSNNTNHLRVIVE